MITPEDLAKWQELCTAATPGPWVYKTSEFGEYTDSGFREERIVAPEGDFVLADACNLYDTDAAFIAAAREAMPRLIAEVQRCHSLLKKARLLGYSNGPGKENIDD